MWMTRRAGLSCVVAAGLALPAGAGDGRKEPLTPEQAWRQEDGAAITVRFEVRKDFAVADAAEGEIYLVHLASGRFAEGERSAFRVVVTDKCRREFARVGVATLGAHFAGRVVTVRGRVSRATHPGPGGHTGGVDRELGSLTVVALTI